ncbi:MAG: hypothetical protein WCO00_06085 [Rhodospirillaceae bacterium]
MSVVADAIRAASEAAAALPAVIPQSSTEVAAVGPAPSMEAFMSSGVKADYYIQPEKTGYLQLDKKGAFEEISAAIIISEIKAVAIARFGDPAKYYKTYNGTHAATGEAWGEVLRMGYATDPKFKGAYNAVELIFVNQKDIVIPKLDLNIPQGATLGYTTTSTTGRLVQSFIATACQKGLDACLVTLSCEKLKSSKFVWGGLKINLVGPWDIDGE